MRHATALLLLFLCGCGDSKPGAKPADASWRSANGESLIARANCLSCHTASDAVRERIRTVAAPRLLDAVGSRMTPDALRAFVANPTAVRSSSRMPDVLHGIPAAEKPEVVEDLVHFLTSQRTPEAAGPAPTDILPDELKRGEMLFNSIGCAACHAADSLAYCADTTWHASLAAFLREPLVSHPGGLMPDLHLTAQEASAIAAHLLEKQAADADGEVRPARAPGLRVEYFERTMDDAGLPDDDHASIRVFVAPTVSLDAPHREDEFALHFTGEIEIPTTGTYTFYLGSDDGSVLTIDGRTVIDNSGAHSFAFKTANVDLDAGWHPIRVRYWEIAVDNDLRFEWRGPGINREPVPAQRLSHTALHLTPRTSAFTLDPDRVKRGGERFVSLGCVNCHGDGSPNAKPFQQLAAQKGCLAGDVPTASPAYHLSDADRATLNAAIAHASSLETPLPPKSFVEHALIRLGCTECHPRGELGPSRDKDAVFTADGSAELGDQGRLPPRLDHIGDKFRPKALDEQIAKGTKVRPYMRTRMPSFGADALRGVSSAFVAADHDPKHDTTVEFSAESATTGRMLAGSTGVSCITCHTVNGRASLGVPAVDLGTMYERLRPGWFLSYLENPTAFTPGTRMTRFWMPNERIFVEHCQGDANKQREALWNYLSLGDAMPVPAGLLAAPGEYELVPGKEPIVFGTFMQGVSPRAICVGYPELLHVAFDAQHARLAKAWRGEFMNAKGTWDGRAGQLEAPLGKSSIELPQGPAFAILASRDDAWPTQQARYRGTVRDAQRRPSFVVELTGASGGTTIAERPVPVLRAGGAWLRRSIEATADEDRTDVYVRAAVGQTIEPVLELGRGGFVVDGKLRIATDAAGAFVRRVGDHAELLVPIDFKYVEGSEPRYRASFAVDMDW